MTVKTTSKSLLARARKLNRQDGPLFLTIENDPEARRLGLPMASDREALIGEDRHQAAPDESTKDFHARLRKLVCDRGKPYGFIILGHPSNIEPPTKAPPYPWADKPWGRAHGYAGWRLVANRCPARNSQASPGRRARSKPTSARS
jgi:hypothetical protein